MILMDQAIRLSLCELNLTGLYLTKFLSFLNSCLAGLKDTGGRIPRILNILPTRVCTHKHTPVKH